MDIENDMKEDGRNTSQVDMVEKRIRRIRHDIPRECEHQPGRRLGKLTFKTMISRSILQIEETRE